MDETWRVLLALIATAVVGAGAYIAIRFLIGLHL